ncbi:hypothetical protein D4764_07G0000010 [Takifugu flavidus]|uniref:Uncharacterized protein n=1 Tax=Takifugu flavidus TaxID=433684 RepID=A0A5C6MPX2_9TELE|nr:hypothetical protein D4764_07G0000010 [Takifugu flavidus]
MRQLTQALMEPAEVAVVKCKGHSKENSLEGRGNSQRTLGQIQAGLGINQANKQAKILWDFQIQTDKLVVANQPDIVVVVIDVAIPSDSNIRKKEHEKLEKYQGLKEEMERMWGMKATVVPVVISHQKCPPPLSLLKLYHLKGASGSDRQKVPEPKETVSETSVPATPSGVPSHQRKNKMSLQGKPSHPRRRTNLILRKFLCVQGVISIAAVLPIFSLVPHEKPDLTIHPNVNWKRVIKMD